MNKSVIALLILGSSLPLTICAHAETGDHTLPLRTLIVDALNASPGDKHEQSFSLSDVGRFVRSHP